MSVAACSSGSSGSAPSSGAHSKSSGGAQPINVSATIAKVPALTWAAWMAMPSKIDAPGGGSVNLTVNSLDSSSNVMLALQSGHIDMGPVSLNVVASALANNPNLPVKVIAGLGNGTGRIVVRKGTGLQTLQDLKGKSVCTVTGSNEYVEFEVALSTVGMTINDVRDTDVSAPTNCVIGLRTGQFDAFVSYAPYTLQAVAEGFGVMPTSMDSVMAKTGSSPTGVVVRDSFLQAHPEAAQLMIDKYIQIWQHFAKDRNAWVDAYLTNGSGDRKVLLEAAKQLPIQFQMDQQLIVNVMKYAAKFKIIPKDTSSQLASILDYSLLAKATGETAKQLGASS